MAQLMVSQDSQSRLGGWVLARSGEKYERLGSDTDGLPVDETLNRRSNMDREALAADGIVPGPFLAMGLLATAGTTMAEQSAMAKMGWSGRGGAALGCRTFPSQSSSHTSPANNGVRKDSRLTLSLLRQHLLTTTTNTLPRSHSHLHKPSHTCRRNPTTSEASMAATSARCTIQYCIPPLVTPLQSPSTTGANYTTAV